MQLRLQEPVAGTVAGFAAAEVAETQEFWQFMASVSQAIEQLVNAVAAAGNWGGVKGIG